MINTLIVIAKMLLAVLPFAVLCFVSAKVNLPKIERSKQFLMPVIAVIYVIVAMFLMNSINEWLIKLINNIPVWIAALGSASWMPAKIGSVISQIAATIKTVLESLNLNFWIFFISNAAIIAVYLIIKRLCLAIMSKAVKMDGKIHTKISGIFYEYFPEKSKWCIKESYAQVRGMLKVFYYSAVVISIILMLASRNFYFDGLIKSIFYPVFGILVVGELYFYLDGATKREYSGHILGEDEDAYKVVNYSLLRKFLRSVFGDKLLAENTSINNALSYDITTDEIIRELEKSEDPKIECFAAYVDALNKTGFSIDHNYLRSSLDMLNGKSILFNNPFYNDLIPYAFYPMNRALLSHQKVLVVLGRHYVEDDITEWLQKGIEAVTNIPFLWNIGVLNSEEQDLDIGIVTRSDVLDIKLHNANAQFLDNVGFVVIIEPSKLIATAQIGLNLLIKKCKTTEDKNIVYCMCDKNCDGLVDAMSHVLMTSITEVSATEKHLGTSSYMCWEADQDYLHHRLLPNISRYLGVGTELSFAALKNQVSKTKWFGGEAFPVTDMRWIDRQYYYDLTKYAGLPTNQEAMDEHFITTPNFWSAEVDKNNYLTVEDESYNMFEILRDFSTRTTEQGFINIVSSEYLLKDYMADNASIFEADAKAIPCIVADYTRSERNTILRLALMMSTFPVSSDILEKEMSLLGITVFDLKKQLWYELYNCYSGVAKIAELPDDYVEAVESTYTLSLRIANSNKEWTNDIIRTEETFNLKSGKMETTYSIVDSEFLRLCVTELRSAGYVAEDEKGEKYYLGAELSGHIYQKYLPGQFFTFGGKYYEMQYLTADGKILVRRAADHINGRPAYRQKRKYVISGIKPSDRIGAYRDIAGMKVVKEFADIRVETPGYYLMQKYNDFTSAKYVSFEGGNDKNSIPKRYYNNKEILRIELPDFDGKLNDNIRYTITVLFNEIFKTIFAENQAYICAVTDTSFLEDNTEDKPLTYSIMGEGYDIQENAIYIIEDSQLDLGLTVAVERNLQRIFSIIYDYLDWHMETLEDSLNPPPDPAPPIIFNSPEEDEEAEKGKKKGIKGIFSAIGNGIKKIIDKIKGWFKKKPKKGEEPTDESTDEPTGDQVPTGNDVPTDTPEAPQDEQTGDTTPAETTPESDGEQNNEKKKGIFGWLKPKKKKKTEEETPANDDEQAPKKKKKGIFDWLKPKKKKTDEEIPAEDETNITDTPSEENGEGETNGEGASDEAVEITDETVEIGDEDTETADDTTEPTEQVDEPTDNGETATDEEVESDKSEQEGVYIDPIDNTEAPSDNDYTYSTDDSTESNIGFSSERKPYHERYYMLYGKDCEASFIDLTGTLDYLAAMGLQQNALKQAREGKKIAEFVEATFTPNKPDARYCDFCGTEIFGVEYETLADGRDRCLNCGRTAIKTGEEFRKIFEDVKRNLESFFGIRIDAGIKVEMVNSKTLHKRLGHAFIPTPNSDGRILGVAIKDKNGYSLYVENGSPRMASMLTMAHELTHIWQYLNWNDKHIRKKYGKDMRLEIYEGMAKWVEIQYAYLINEPATAKREEIITSRREDEYGYGFLRYRANYPFSLGTVITKDTPFLNKEEPLNPEYCGAFTVILPTDGVNPGDIEAERAGRTGRGGKPRGGDIGSIKGPKERTPGKVNKYAYSFLTDEEKAVYDTFLNAINNFEAEVTDIGGTVNKTQISKIIDYIQRDHPELFWYQYGACFYFDTQTEIVSRVELKYCMTQEEAKKRQEKIDTATKAFLTAVNDTMSDYEVALHIYENIIKLVDYDTIGLERQKKTETSPEIPDDLRSLYGVFVNKKAVCAGYAKAMQYLLNVCGIECTYITSETHAWNLIKLEGDYYHMDVTWGDGSNTDKQKSQSNTVNYDYFCITTEEVEKLESHIPESILPLPKCTATKCNYHRRHGLYFEKFDFDKVRNIVCESAKLNRFDLSFKFASTEVFYEAKKQLLEEKRIREAIQYAGLKSGVKLSSAYLYSEKEQTLTINVTMLKM